VSFVDLAIKSILAATFGWAAISLLRRSSASTRHAALFITLIGVSLLPAVLSFLPRWHVPFLQLKEATHSAAPPVELASGSGVVLSAIQHTPVAVSQPINWAGILLGIWVGVAAILCVRVAIRLWKLRLAERQLPMTSDACLQALVTERCRRSGRHVVLLEGDTGEPPMTWGFSRPVLVLPADASEWPDDRLDAVVLHELAHIERGDWMASIVGQLACAIYWFNPFVWMINRRMEIESETAADDRVLSLGVSATQYASHLVGITRDLRLARTSTHVALAMARPGSLDRRVLAILEARRCRRTVRGVVTLGLIATVAGVVVAVGAAAPTMVREVLNTPPDVSITSKHIDDNSFDNSDGDDSKLADMTDESAGGELNLGAIPDEPTFPVTHKKKDKSHAGDAKPCAPLAPKPSVVVSVKPVVQTPKPARKVSSDDWNGVPPDIKIDLKDMEAEMKKAGVEVNSETAKALKELSQVKDLNELAKLHIDTNGIMEAVGKITAASTKAAIVSANKVVATQMANAMKDIKRLKQNPPAALSKKHGP